MSLIALQLQLWLKAAHASTPYDFHAPNGDLMNVMKIPLDCVNFKYSYDIHLKRIGRFKESKP